MAVNDISSTQSTSPHHLSRLIFWLTQLRHNGMPRALLKLMDSLGITIPGLVQKWLVTNETDYILCLSMICWAFVLVGQISAAISIAQMLLAIVKMSIKQPFPIVYIHLGALALLIGITIASLGNIHVGLHWLDVHYALSTFHPFTQQQTVCYLASGRIVLLLCEAMTMNEQHKDTRLASSLHVWLSRLQTFGKDAQYMSSKATDEVGKHFSGAFLLLTSKFGSTSSLTIVTGRVAIALLEQVPELKMSPICHIALLHSFSDFGRIGAFVTVFWKTCQALSETPACAESVNMLFALFYCLRPLSQQARTTVANKLWEKLAAYIICLVASMNMEHGLLEDRLLGLPRLVACSGVDIAAVRKRVKHLAAYYRKKGKEDLSCKIQQESKYLRDIAMEVSAQEGCGAFSITLSVGGQKNAPY